MGNRRFSVTTVVLVVALLGALYGMGHLVNPPPPTPPEEKKEEKSIPLTPEQQKNREKAMREKENDYRTNMMKKAPPQMPSLPPAANPDAVDVSGKHWTNSKMGEEGVKESAAEYAKKKAKWDEWVKKSAKQTPPQVTPQSPTMPPPTPTSAPMPAAATPQ